MAVTIMIVEYTDTKKVASSIFFNLIKILYQNEGVNIHSALMMMALANVNKYVFVGKQLLNVVMMFKK